MNNKLILNYQQNKIYIYIMENIKDKKRLKYLYNDKNYTRDNINSINHTNINNNINITNYYPSPNQNYCSKQTFTFIDENGSIQNAISYPIKTASQKTKRLKDSSPKPNEYDKKYHECQSPYMKKILPNSKRQKSEEGNRIINIYKNSPSTRYLKSNRKKSLKNNFYNENILKKNITEQNINNNRKINRENYKYYLDLSTDEINNKYKSNRICNSSYNNTSITNNTNNKSEINKKFTIYKSSLANKPFLLNNKSKISYDSNLNYYNGNESLLNILEPPYQISMATKHPLPFSFQHLYKINSYDQNNFFPYNGYHSPKLIKNEKHLKYSHKNEFSAEKKLIKYIILIQSTLRGFLLRLKLAQYLTLYERIKKAVSFIQYIIFQRMRYVFYILIKYNINKKLINYYNISKYLIPENILSFEIKKRNGKIFSNEDLNIKNKNMYFETNEIQKELNKKKIDYAIVEKRIKELLLENKKIQNINKIIVRDNKQLALKLKNSQKTKHAILKIQNTNFYILTNTFKNKIKQKLFSLLRNIINKKDIKTKTILYKYFYKFNYKTKLIKLNIINNNNKIYSIQKNDFIIRKNILDKKYNNIVDKNNDKDINLRNKIMKNIIRRKNMNSYIFRNTFEKWVMKAMIIRNKEFIKEKKKKKKEKFKQRKQKKLFGNHIEKNIKKNEDENENSGDSDDFDLEQKNSNKSESNKKTNDFYDNDK